MKRRGLGGALLGQGQGSDVETVLQRMAAPAVTDERTADPRAIRPNPHQPRQDFDPEKLAELAESIRSQGLLQPLLVRETVTGLELLAGERRQRAAIMAGLQSVPIRIHNVDDATAAAVALTENLAREDLTPWEEAIALAQLRDALAARGRKPNRDELAAMVGRSAGSVSESLQIADGISSTVVRLAGLTRQNLTGLPKTALHGASRAKTSEERAALLRLAVGVANAPGKAVRKAGKAKRGRPTKAWTITDRLRDRGTLSFNLRTRPEEMDPDDARDALARLDPLVKALRLRASGY